MSHETINLICAELPGTEKSEPEGGEDAWTIGGQPFARVGSVGVEVRGRDAGAAPVGAGAAPPEPSWASLPLDAPEAELRRRIVEAYELVRATLPQEVQVTLDRTSG